MITRGSTGIDDAAYEYDQPVLFYTLATAIPWACWFAAAYLSHLPGQTSGVLVATAILGLLGLAAPIGVVVYLVRDRPRLRADIRRRLLRPGAPRYYAAAIGVAVGSILAAQAVSLLLGYSAEQFSLRGGFTFTAGLLPVWVTLVGAAILEELAWHSYGTDTLLRRFSVFTASMVFTVIWALWHAPLSFIEGYYHAELVEMGWLHTLNFPASMVAFVLIMNWLYFASGRSILLPIVFHVAANVSNEIFLTHPDTKIIQTVLMLAVAATVITRNRRMFFARPAHLPRS